MDDPLASHDPDPHANEGSGKRLKLFQLPAARRPLAITVPKVLASANTSICV